MFKKRSKLPPRPDDIDEARQSRARDAETLEALHGQANYVARLGDRIVEAKKYDHFGDSLEDTFTRKGLT